MIFDRSIRTARALVAAMAMSWLLALNPAVAGANKASVMPTADASQRVVVARTDSGVMPAWDQLWPMVASGVGIVFFMARRSRR